MREEHGLTARIFASLDISVERVRAQVVRTVSPRAFSDVEFTREAKKALELAVREARSLSHHYTGPEHILLGLLREDEGLATRSLALLQIDAKRLARTAQAVRPLAWRFACPDAYTLAACARAYVETQAAFEAGDLARASALRRRSWMLETIRPRPTRERAEAAVVARLRALLR